MTHFRYPNLIHLRSLRAASLVGTLAIGAAASLAGAGVKSWNGIDGFWSSPSFWSPFGTPTALDTVFIGNTAVAANGLVTLDSSASALAITLSDGMQLTNGASKLTVSDFIAVTGENVTRSGTVASTLRVAAGASIVDVETSDLSVAAGGRVELDGGTLLVDDAFEILVGGSCRGSGLLALTGNVTPSVRNDGAIRVDSGLLTLDQDGAGRIDLDGSGAADVSLLVGMSSERPPQPPGLRITGVGLADAMDDHIHIGSGAELLIELDEGWTLGPSDEIVGILTGNDDGPARVKISHVTVEGTLRALGTGSLVFDAPTTLAPTAFAEVDEGCLLWLWGSTVQGGTYVIDADGDMKFSGETTVEGGHFITGGPNASDGGVEFGGPTTYDGTITIDGYGRQSGDANVLGATVINADAFNFSGLSESTWSISNSLTLNVASIGFANGVYDDIDLTASVLGRMTVNLAEPGAMWHMLATLNLSGLGPIMITRIAGSGVDVAGAMKVATAVQITAPLELSTASVEFATDASRLRVTNATTVSAQATFAGGGRVEVAPEGSIMLDDGANLGATDLANEGELSVAAGAGMANVDRIELAPTSTWHVGIGGYDAGTQYDRLLVNGLPNAIGGQLDVALLDLGEGHFQPSIGDVFTIMMAPPASLVGTFANGPVSSIPGKTYLWTVGYESGEVAQIVTLTVADIVQCKADLNGDGIVDAADLAILLGEWGPNPQSLADFNADGGVGGDDLAELLGAWGLCFIH
ncbi:MAG: hypothetical protein JNM94_07200 [Phycisphaerae bacterium]|nr:hypothetical protein [Phycisphaerae bacterium]